MINKFESFDIKSIPYTKNCDTSMLTNEVSKVNINDGSIDIKFDVDTYRPLIPCIDWRNTNDD